MPSGIIMQSSSAGQTEEERQQALEKVMTDNGHEPEKPEAQQQEAELVEPKREDFKTDEEFEAAQEAHETKLEEQEAEREKQEEEAERKRLEALPKKSRRQKAVEKATKELNDKLKAAEERLAALEGKKKPAAEPKGEELKAPNRDDFKTDEEFEDALFDYRYKLRRAKEDADAQKNRLQERLAANFTDYKDSVAAFKEEHDDWDTVVNQALAIPEAVYYAIVDLGKEGPAVTYYLGQHPELIDDLSELTPYRAAIEIGRLVDKLKPGSKTNPGGEKPRTPKPKPNIPEPITPVTTAATSSTLTSRDAAQKRDYKAFKAARRRGA